MGGSINGIPKILPKIDGLQWKSHENMLKLRGTRFQETEADQQIQQDGGERKPDGVSLEVAVEVGYTMR